MLPTRRIIKIKRVAYKMKGQTRSKYWEFFINFSLFYSLIVGITFISYSIYRGLFSLNYYIIAVVIFTIYLISWIIDKMRVINERRTEN